MRKTAIFLDDDTRLLLRRIARHEGKTRAEVLRAARTRAGLTRARESAAHLLPDIA
jgi:hypothetical protein